MTFSGSVVAKTNLHVLGRLLDDLQQGVEALRRDHVGLVDDEDLVAVARRREERRARAGRARRRRRRGCAASISMTSRLPGPPRARSRQESHSPHGVAVGPCAQFRQRARMRALVVLPQPRGPREQVGVVDAVVVAAPADSGTGHVLLADDLGEGLGPVAAVQRGGHAPHPNPGSRQTHRPLAKVRPWGAHRPAVRQRGLPAHPAEPAYPCCLPALGGFGWIPPHGESGGHSTRPAGGLMARLPQGPAPSAGRARAARA